MFDIQKEFYENNNPYFPYWKDVLESNLPNRINNVIKIDYNDFKKKYINDNKNCEDLVNSLLAGDLYLLKNVFTKKYINDLKDYVANRFLTDKSEFHKVLDGVPNFTRDITSDLGKKYSFNQRRQLRYFFPFNEKNEAFKVYETIYPVWRNLKYLMGYKKDVWEKNKPSDGIVDRLLVSKYPPGEGEMELHQDPYLFQKFFISIYMSKKGEDYINGGVYAIDKDDKEIDIEQDVDVGDLSFGMATIMHGVAKCEIGKNKDPKDILSGRWFLGLYTMQTDYYKDRHTGKPVKDLSKIK